MSEIKTMARRDRLAEMRHNYTIKLISEFIPPNSRVLDIGGHKNCAYWRTFGKQYDVISLNIDKTISPDYALDIEKNDLTQIRDEFCYATMFDVIEHLENPMAALRNVRSVLKKDGLFLGSTPNRFDPYMLVGAKINDDHNYVFDKLTLRHLLLKCGFKVVATRSRVFPIQLSRKIFIPIDLSKLLPTGRVFFWVATIPQNE